MPLVKTCTGSNTCAVLHMHKLHMQCLPLVSDDLIAICLTALLPLPLPLPPRFLASVLADVPGVALSA